MRKGRHPEQSYQTVWVFGVSTINNFCCVSAYQGIEHQRVERVAVRVLHHDVEQSIQSVLQELKWQMHIIVWQANDKIGQKKHIWKVWLPNGWAAFKVKWSYGRLAVRNGIRDDTKHESEHKTLQRGGLGARFESTCSVEIHRKLIVKWNSRQAINPNLVNENI